MLSDDLIKSIVGMTEETATETVKAGSAQNEILVIRRDEEAFMSDGMMNDNRVKVEIEKGFVVKAVVG